MELDPKILRAVDLVDSFLQLHGTAIVDGNPNTIFTAACETRDFTFLRVGATIQISRANNAEVLLYLSPTQVINRLSENDIERLLALQGVQASDLHFCKLTYRLEIERSISEDTDEVLEFERLLWRVLKQSKRMKGFAPGQFRWVHDGIPYLLQSEAGRVIKISTKEQVEIEFSKGEAVHYNSTLAEAFRPTLERVAHFQDLLLLQSCVLMGLDSLPFSEDWGKCLLLARADQRIIVRQVPEQYYLIQRQDNYEEPRTVWLGSKNGISLDFSAPDLRFCLRTLQNHLALPFFRYLQLFKPAHISETLPTWEMDVDSGHSGANRFRIKQHFQDWSILRVSANEPPEPVVTLNNFGDAQIMRICDFKQVMTHLSFSSSDRPLPTPVAD